MLFWLGDDSQGHQATWEFLDRRIEDVMKFEKFKAAVNDNAIAKAVMAGPMAILSKLRAPVVPKDMPGQFRNFKF